MKISKLLVLSAAWLGMSSSAMADVPDGIWTAPDPSEHLTFTEFTDDGERYILFNPATKMFFASGNGWNTMASLRTFGMEIWLQESTEADAPEGSYELWDNNVNNPARNTGEGNVFTDDGNASWVDHGTQGNYSWGYATVGGFVRFQNVALIADKPEFEGMYLGFDGTYVVTDVSANSGDNRNAYTAILRHVDPNAEGVSVDWRAVTLDSYEQFVYDEDAYNAYVNGMKTYIASIGLKKAIKDAEALFIDVTNATAVYMNKESTATQMANSTASLNELITVKEKLQKAINEAKEKGFDGAASFEAVLQNTAATKTDVEKAISDLNDAFVEWGKNQASVANPVDMSGKIVNSTFDNGDCTTGWSGDAFGRGGAVSDGAEHYSKNYNTYQKISGLAAGIYAVGVNGYYRSGNYGGTAESHFLAKDEASKYAKFYATVGERNFETSIANVLSGAQAEIQNVGDVEVTYTDPETEEAVTVYSPNTMVAGDHYMHVLGQYANKLFVIVDEAGELTIGVKKTSQIDGDWSMFDDFSLTYYGKGADACQLYLDETMKNYGDYSIDEGVLFTEAYLDAYKQACTGPKTASTIEEVYAVLDAVEGAKSAIDENIKLWKNYQKAIEKGKLMLVDSELQEIEEVGDLGDYIEIEYEDYVKALALTNEQLTTEIEKLESLMTTIETKSKMEVYDGKDMTKYIKNPGFDEDENKDFNGAEGWTIDRISGGNVVRGPLGQGNQDLMKSVLGEENFCFESWHCHKWDIWQEVEGLPEGMYELQVQGYVRCEVGGYSAGDELEGEYASPVYLYMNNAMSSFPSVYSEQVADEHYVDGALPVVEGHSWNGALANYPNSMGAASLCFKWGMYKTTAYGLIAKEGDKFRIGVKMDKNQDWWCIFDNFKLIYRTPSAELVKPILMEELAKIDLEKPMGKNVFAQAEAVTKAAQEAIANNDGAAMFAALTDAYDLSAAIIASTALFADLSKANEDFFMTLNSDKAVNTAALSEANTLYNTVASGIENHEYEDADVPGLLDKMAVLRTKITLPDGYEAATDDNKAEFTNAIQNPSFYDDEQAVNSSTGWKNPGNLGNDDEQKSAEAMEFWQIAFDMSQTIVGLPEGTYIVQADAWCRVGGNDENYEAWKADPAATMAYLYAVDGDSTVYSVPVANMMKAGDILLEATGYQGEAEFTTKVEGEDVTYYLPGSLVSGKGIIELNDGVYTNKVIAKVKADGKLTIGIKKATEKANSWVVCDDFKLFYCGTGSSLTPSDDASTSIESIAKPVQVKVEYFTLDGRKATRLQKGLMIQKVTFENGATIVKKIRK